MVISRGLKQINRFNNIWSFRGKKSTRVNPRIKWSGLGFLKNRIQYKEHDPNTEVATTENFWNCYGFLVNMHNIDSQCLHTALLCFGAAIQWGNDIAGNPGLKECLVQGSGRNWEPLCFCRAGCSPWSHSLISASPARTAQDWPGSVTSVRNRDLTNAPWFSVSCLTSGCLWQRK